MRQWWRRQPREKRQAVVAARRKPTLAENRARYEQRQRDPEWGLRAKARWTLSNAIRDGRITREPCEVCGDPDTQGHHDDYSKPLEVRWLCNEHHSYEHRKAA